MKNLFLSAFALLSFSAFAQESQDANQNSVRPIDSPKVDCFIGVIFECDEFGNPIKDPSNPKFKAFTITVYSLNSLSTKQSIYCETGIIDNDC